MISIDYGFYHIERVFRMIKGDQTALDDMDISGEGFWRSFTAIIFVMPALFFSGALDAKELAGLGGAQSKAYIVIVQAIIEVALWLLPVLALVFATRLLGYADRFAHLIIARNWFAVPLYYLVALIELAGLITGSAENVLFLMLIMLLVMIGLSIRLTRMALQSPLSIAAGLVIIELIFLLPLSVWIYDTAGLVPAVSP